MKLSQLLSAPNQLTLLRMLFLPFIVDSLLDQHYLLALILFVLAGFSDGLDGLLARRLHQHRCLAANHGNEWNGKAFTISNKVRKFRSFSRIGECQHRIISSDHSQIAVAGLTRMDKQSRRSR